MVDFQALNGIALDHCPGLLFDLLPGGRLVGVEYQARNPRRADKRLGSFSINVRSGRWSDFATGDKGGDLVSLVAFVWNLRQSQAAHELACLLGVPHGR